MSGFFTGFATGFGNRATEINRENDAARNRAIEQAMARFSVAMERRRDEMNTRVQQRAQARVISRGIGMSENTAEALVMAGLGGEAISGRITADGGEQGGGLATPAPAPSNQPPAASAAATPTSVGGGLVSPPTANAQAPVADPREAVAAQAPAQAQPSAPSVPQEGEAPGIRRQIGNALFGRGPMDGVGEEVRQRYMQETGMSQEQLNTMLAPPPEAPQMDGNIRINQFTPAEMARMSQSFNNPEGFERFWRSGGRDMSGLSTLQDITRAQAIIRAAGSRGGGGTPRITPSHYNATIRALATMLPANSNLRTYVDPATGSMSIVPAIPTSDPRYAETQRMAANIMVNASAALNGRVPEINPADPFLSAEYAARNAGILGGGATTPPPPPPPGGASTAAPRTIPPPAAPGYNPSGAARPGSSRNNPVAVNTPEEAARLAPGTFFRNPNGEILQNR